MDSTDVEYSSSFLVETSIWANDTKKSQTNHKLMLKYLKTKDIPNKLQPENVSILCKFKIQSHLRRG